MQEQTIKTKLEKLPEELRKQVFDYVDFLLLKFRERTKKTKFKFDWAGGLSALKKYSSVELQHKATGWR
ncbi:MAG: hypothetical protein COS68_06110 [Elusimicrobia bacterium CG06_land_8_20_14_3_00_38_11]|nr:MAG: hypothetical protein COS68_06110 [Elusimicrobia bacterium CG06_land_8_20_14_3_00_38_11]